MDSRIETTADVGISLFWGGDGDIFKVRKISGLPGGLSVKTLCFLQGARVQSLVGELRSRMPWPRKKGKKKFEYPLCKILSGFKSLIVSSQITVLQIAISDLSFTNKLHLLSLL